MWTLRSTKKQEDDEVIAAATDVRDARRDLDRAQAAVKEAHAPLLSPLADVEDAQWVRVSIAERRQRDARDARSSGNSRRERRAAWRSIFSIQPLPLPQPIVPRPTVLAATLSFLDARGPHDSGEDLHPSRLDASEERLEEALRLVEAKNARREARDA